MTEPTRDALHADAAWIEAQTIHYVDKPDRDRLRHAAACVRRVPELEAEVARLRAEIADPMRWMTSDGDSVPLFMRPTPRTDG